MERVSLGSYKFERAEIEEFSESFGSSLAQIDSMEDSASQLQAPEWLIASIGMRLFVENYKNKRPTASDSSDKESLGAGLGVKEVQWPEPVFEDNVLEYFCEVLEAASSRKHPGFAIVTVRISATNESKALVYQADMTGLEAI